MSTATVVEEEERITLAEYLALEEKSPSRHEYHAGAIYDMAGGSPAHAQISFNVAVGIGKRLQGKRCRGASGDQRIRIEAADTEVYPDAVVVCPPARYAETDPHALTNPALIVEVLSPSTESYDRNGKFELYARIPELRDYLLISQERVLVEHFQRTEDGDGWLLRRFNQCEGVVRLENLEIEVPVAEIYDGLDLPSGLIVTRPDTTR